MGPVLEQDHPGQVLAWPGVAKLAMKKFISTAWFGLVQLKVMVERSQLPALILHIFLHADVTLLVNKFNEGNRAGQ